MKRRNAECGKLRRPIKRNKIAEGMYGSNTFLYVKYLILWAVVITADFMLDFRFEFLWPFWLLLRSVYDSFKYKGLAFSILFVCIAITSDLVCLFFIPVSWLFFLASTYVWVQYVWHADKGFCLPTIFLWMLFLYLEGAVRWRDDSKNIPHVDLCRPFAAHCIGYPVVTLGFGVKSYVGYRIRHRKQREVSKENEFYMQLLHLALPNDDPSHDELISQMRQASELLHSDKLGEIDLPVSSAIIAQRIQQQQLLSPISLNTRERGPTLCWTPSQVASSSTAPTTTTTTTTTTTRKPTFTNAKHVVANGQSMNGGLSTLSSASATMSTAPPTGSGSMPSLMSTATNNTLNFLHHTNLSHASGSAITQNGTAANHHNNIHNNNNNHHQHNHHTSSSAASSAATTSTTSLTSILTYRNNRRSVDRSDKCNNDPATPISRVTSNGLNNNLKSSDTTSTTTTTAAAGHSKCRSNVAAPTASGTVHTNGYRMSFFREAGRITETITSSMYSIKHKMFGGTASGHNNNATASAVNASTVPTGKHMNQQRISPTADTSESHSVNNTSASIQAINSMASTTAISNAHSSIASSSLASSSASSLCSAANTLHTTQMPPAKNASFALLSTNSGTSRADAATTIGSGYKETRNNDCSTINQHHQQQQQQPQQHNNGLPNGTGKEKPNAKLNGNSDYELNSHQISHSHTDHHHIGNGEIVEKNRGAGRRNRAKQTPLQPLQPQPCDSCHKFEIENKKYRSEISQLKQSENDLRQKCEQHSTIKSCLQVKQRENDELEKKILEMTNARQTDRQNLQQTERRLGDERRQKQSLEAQLSNERKQRKQAEEKATRPDCNESCKQRKLVLETECKQLRRELTNIDELKKSAEQQSRNYEQELRKFEAELRSRESREGTEVLMSALQAMQDKNSTLEKNLSAETRVKLDLFSALGEAKRQLEIRENVIRQKDKEVLELKAKIAQLYAVMPSVPNDSFMAQCSTAGSSILRLNDGSLQGPASPMSHAHMSLGGSPLMNQLQSLSVFTSTASSTSPQNTTSQSTGVELPQQQSQQQSNGNMETSSSLDPNATAYTPKNDV